MKMKRVGSRSKADEIKHIGIARLRTVEGYTLETYRDEYSDLIKMPLSELRTLKRKEIAKARAGGHLKEGY